MRTRKLVISLVVACLIATTIVVVQVVRSAGSTQVCQVLDRSLHQLVNADSATNLLTYDAKEISNAVKGFGFTDLGEVAKVAGSPGEGLVPIIRMQRQGDFLWAQTKVQQAAAEQRGYVADGPAFYAPGSGTDSCLIAVYQVEQGLVHRVAVGEAARDTLTEAGWRSPQLIFYAVEGEARPAGEKKQALPTGPAAGEIDRPDSDQRFTIAVIPDTQNEAHRAADPRLRDRVDYLLDNQDRLDLRFAIHTGDLVDWDTPDHRQYVNAAKAFLPLQAAMPWAVAVGSHDTAAVCPGGDACPGTASHLALRDTRTFNRYFPSDHFGAFAGRFEDQRMDNAFHTFRAGGRDWLVLTLEPWPREEVLDWAAELVADEPERNVILVTHAYLTEDGEISDSNGGYGNSAPRVIYDRLVSRYPNVKLVLSGHTGLARVRTDTTAGENRVVSMMATFQSKQNNPVRLIEIDTERESMRTWIYVPSTDKRPAEFAETITGLDFVR